LNLAVRRTAFRRRHAAVTVEERLAAFGRRRWEKRKTAGDSQWEGESEETEGVCTVEIAKRDFQNEKKIIFFFFTQLSRVLILTTRLEINGSD